MCPTKKKAEKPLTLSDFNKHLTSHLTSHLIKFYQDLIEPEFKEMKKFREELIQFRHEVNQRFDDLYKKFEDLHQEYIIVNKQMKQHDDCDEITQKDINDLKAKVSLLQKQVDELELRLQAH